MAECGATAIGAIWRNVKGDPVGDQAPCLGGAGGCPGRDRRDRRYSRGQLEDPIEVSGKKRGSSEVKVRWEKNGCSLQA
jgi:hypothetical protein